MNGSVALGFGAIFATGAVVALVSAGLAWALVRTPAAQPATEAKGAAVPAGAKDGVLAAAE